MPVPADVPRLSPVAPLLPLPANLPCREAEALVVLTREPVTRPPLARRGSAALRPCTAARGLPGPLPECGPRPWVSRPMDSVRGLRARWPLRGLPGPARTHVLLLAQSVPLLPCTIPRRRRNGRDAAKPPQHWIASTSVVVVRDIEHVRLVIIVRHSPAAAPRVWRATRAAGPLASHGPAPSRTGATQLSPAHKRRGPAPALGPALT